MTPESTRHNTKNRDSAPGQPVGQDRAEADARIVTDTNLVLGCAAMIALLIVLALIAYLWTL